MRIGYRVDAVTTITTLCIYKASLLKSGDVAIGISHSGNSLETVHALKLAKEAGASTIALTHNLAHNYGICRSSFN